MDLVLILARDLASHLATAMFLVNTDGACVYYNEPAESLLGVPFAEAGALQQIDWSAKWYPEDPETGENLPPEALPLSIALMERRPAHRTICITGSDEVRRTVRVTAFPLMVDPNTLVGALAIFWETRGGGD